MRVAGLALLAVLAAAPAGGGEPRTYAGAELDFTLRCKGCHGFAGQGTSGHVPRLRGFVGLYTHLPEGRDYLLRVPGVARAQLNDDRLAAVLNWMIEAYGRGTAATGFAPFTPEEVAAARRRPLAQKAATRARLIAELRRQGLLAADEDGYGLAPEPGG
jgi:hypothetical protein